MKLKCKDLKIHKNWKFCTYVENGWKQKLEYFGDKILQHWNWTVYILDTVNVELKLALFVPIVTWNEVLIAPAGKWRIGIWHNFYKSRIFSYKIHEIYFAMIVIIPFGKNETFLTATICTIWTVLYTWCNWFYYTIFESIKYWTIR